LAAKKPFARLMRWCRCDRLKQLVALKMIRARTLGSEALPFHGRRSGSPPLHQHGLRGDHINYRGQSDHYRFGRHAGSRHSHHGQSGRGSPTRPRRTRRKTRTGQRLAAVHSIAAVTAGSFFCQVGKQLVLAPVCRGTVVLCVLGQLRADGLPAVQNYR